MSEKLKEFVDIPQEFVRDGKQVCATEEVLLVDSNVYPVNSS